MAMRKSLLQRSVILGIVILVLAMVTEAKVIKKQSDEALEQRSDIITIDTLESFDSLERPEVIFLHDMHTEALEKTKKDCSTCHLPEEPNKDKLSLKFKRLEDTNKQDIMDLYHAECIGCHKEMTASGQETGPIEICGQCHREETDIVSSRQLMGMDSSLHFRHTKATSAPDKNDCGLCHHEYNEKAKKLFYEKGKEGSCRYCHMNETEENRISMRLASHSACIDCHKKTLAKKKDTGPVKCLGCHDAKEQQKIKKVAEVPRIDRKQPDVVLLQMIEEGVKEEERAARMAPVPFNHKAHEGYNETCLGCHHASLESCSKKCHTTTGSKDGDFINIERAMHQRGYGKSCIGCHDMKQAEPECAACHSLKSKEQKQDSACVMCHMKPQKKTAGAEDGKIVAEMLIKSRKASAGNYEDKDIPEKVIIKNLSDKYEPVELPHRKIIKTLLDGIKDNKLAAYFHAEKGTVCQGCHHNSPPDKKPPTCRSCHGKPFDENELLRPGIKGAYHQQCMGCHKTLNLEKPKATACIECHKEKKTAAVQVVR